MRCVVAGVLAVVVCGCSGTRVVLNERLFELPSGNSEGRGCTSYDLGGGGSSGTGTTVLGWSVAQQSDGGDQVLVVVRQNDGTNQVQKVYGISFFRSGQVDEFTVPASSGAALLLRYWGTVAPGGVAACAPLEEDEPPG